MKQIMYNLSLYFSFLKNSLKEILIYRIDCIVGVISELIVQLVSIIFVLIAFNNTENISGWNFLSNFIIIWNYKNFHWFCCFLL